MKRRRRLAVNAPRMQSWTRDSRKSNTDFLYKSGEEGLQFAVGSGSEEVHISQSLDYQGSSSTSVNLELLELLGLEVPR
jgi:hypothetical protein